MQRRADAGRGEVEHARIGLGIGDQLGDGFDRQRRIDDHHVGEADEARDRLDLAQKFEIELFVEAGIGGVGRRRQQQRVAVGRCADERLGRDIGAAARAALNDELLVEPLRQPLPEQSRRHVGRAARQMADD